MHKIHASEDQSIIELTNDENAHEDKTHCPGMITPQTMPTQSIQSTIEQQLFGLPTPQLPAQLERARTVVPRERAVRDSLL